MFAPGIEEYVIFDFQTIESILKLAVVDKDGKGNI